MKDEEISTRAMVERVLDDLREAYRVLKYVYDEQTRERLDGLLSSAESQLEKLRRLLPVEDETDAPAPYSDEEFARLLRKIKAEWPDRKRLKLLDGLGAFAHFTSLQVRAILETFDWDDKKVEAAVTLYPQLTDPDNFLHALQAIDSPSKRDEVLDRLKLR